jgi:hypothetical protein
VQTQAGVGIADADRRKAVDSGGAADQEQRATERGRRKTPRLPLRRLAAPDEAAATT